MVRLGGKLLLMARKLGLHLREVMKLSFMPRRVIWKALPLRYLLGVRGCV